MHGPMNVKLNFCVFCSTVDFISELRKVAPKLINTFHTLNGPIPWSFTFVLFSDLWSGFPNGPCSGIGYNFLCRSECRRLDCTTVSEKKIKNYGRENPKILSRSVIYLQVKKPSYLFYTKARVKNSLAVGLLLLSSEFRSF